MAETPSSQPGSNPAATPQESRAGVGEGKLLALGLLCAIAKESDDPNILADLGDYLPPKKS